MTVNAETAAAAGWPAGLADLLAATWDALAVYDAALDVVASWLDVGPMPTLGDLDAHGACVDALVAALATAGVLDRATTLDPAAVSRLSPPIRPDPPAVIGPPPDGA